MTLDNEVMMRNLMKLWLCLDEGRKSWTWLGNKIDNFQAFYYKKRLHDWVWCCVLSLLSSSSSLGTISVVSLNIKRLYNGSVCLSWFYLNQFNSCGYNDNPTLLSPSTHQTFAFILPKFFFTSLSSFFQLFRLMIMLMIMRVMMIQNELQMWNMNELLLI